LPNVRNRVALRSLGRNDASNLISKVIVQELMV
jgi:hypothetical protein